MKLRLTAVCPHCQSENFIEEKLESLIESVQLVLTCDHAECKEEFYAEAEILLHPVVRTTGLYGALRPENAGLLNQE